ncbi:MAG TPA: DUF4056 domain-containing protein [Phycisphaerales bacterium]|nr:DUF4056 domain-containing protein [Phycisphaerales bacterium]
MQYTLGKLGRLRAPLIAAAILALSACAGTGRPQPHTRFGALPFPGVTSLFHAADAANLGPHRYTDRTLLGAEGERGIIYTERAGFVDVVHIRLAADWTWYIHTQLQDARRRPDVTAVAFTYEKSRVNITLPQDPAADAAVAAHAACALMTWHEVATWYGYSMVPLVSERRSSFTYDDTVSHLLGAQAAYSVITAGTTWETYDDAMKVELDRVISAAEPRTPLGTRDACTDARGGWWMGNNAILRDTATHLDATPKHPLVLTTTGGATFSDAPVALPPLAESMPQPWFTITVPRQVRERVRTVLGTTTIAGNDALRNLVADVADDLAVRERTIVLHEGDAAAPALPIARPDAMVSTGPLVAQFIAPSRPAPPPASAATGAQPTEEVPR